MDYDKYEHALRMQHPRIHEAEAKFERATTKAKHWHRQHANDRGRRAFPKRLGGGAYQVDDDDDYGGYGDSPIEDHDPTAYAADDDDDDQELLIEMQALVIENYGDGVDLRDLDDDEATALITVAQARAKSKGKGKGNKGKRGGKTSTSPKASDGQPALQNFKASGTITLEQKKIKERQA